MSRVERHREAQRERDAVVERGPSTEAQAVQIGQKVWYSSDSGQLYMATVTAIPTKGQNPNFPGAPTVSLEFRDARGKLVTKERVLHRSVTGGKRKVWFADRGELK